MSLSTNNNEAFLATASGSIVGTFDVIASRLICSAANALAICTVAGITLTPTTGPTAIAHARGISTVAGLTTVDERLLSEASFAVPTVAGSMRIDYFGSVGEESTAIPNVVGDLEFDLSLLAILWPGDAEEVSSTLTCEAVGTATARLRSESKAYTLGDAAFAVYALWGFDGLTDLRIIDRGRQRIAEWCNAAMQVIYAQADRLEYFNRERITLTVPDTGSVALPLTVQRSIGEARIGSRPLRPLESKAQVEDFAGYYPGATSPMAFWVESLREGGADSLAMTLHVAPAPSENTEVSLQVTNEPPRWDTADILSGAIIPLPHKWVETLFMPIVRHRAASDSLMPNTRRQAQSKQIDEQYASAMQMLGLADSEPSTAKPEKEGKANA